MSEENENYVDAVINHIQKELHMGPELRETFLDMTFRDAQKAGFRKLSHAPICARHIWHRVNGCDLCWRFER